MSEDNTLSSTSGGPLGEISQAPPALEVFLDRHQMKLIALAILLAIFAIAYIIFQGIEEGKQESAGAKLVKAEGISELQAVAANHNGTAASESAKILLAEKQWVDGRKDEAIGTLQSFLEADSDHPARPSAQASLATKLLLQGKTEEAEQKFRELSTDPDALYISPYALIMLGDIHMGKGDKDAAAKAYETVERDYSNSMFSQQAARRKLLLYATPPVEVEVEVQTVLPETDSGSEDGSPSAADGDSDDLIEAIKGGIPSSNSNPLVPNPESPE